MDEQNQANLEALNQDVDTSVDNESNDTSNQAYINQKLRAEKAEAELKKLKDAMTTKPQEEIKPASSGLSQDEILVIAQVQDKEKIEKLRKIAQLEGVSLSEALNSDLYTTWVASMEAKRKQEEAQLGASRGSGNVAKKKDFNTSGLSKEDHKQLWKEKNGL